MKLASINSHSSRGVRQTSEKGYILLVLVLFVALLTIAAAAVAPSIAFQVRRDREQELIHRGVQYSRAVRRYYKKFNRYPTKIEDLESTNNIRFLRKRYKDPITGADFKVLHLSEVQLALGGGAAGGLTSGANAGRAGNQFGPTANGFGSGNFGSSTTASTPQSKVNGNDSGTADASEQSASASSTTGSGVNQPGSANTSSDKLTGQTFGGGPIAGVVSTNKAQSIREFNKKNHYNEWLFIYDPNSDRGGLLSTPSQPPLQGAVTLTQPGNLGTPGAPGLGFGNQSTGSPGTPFGGGMQPPQGVQPQK